jgi:hypothetical protein
MTIQEFFERSAGKWFSQRTSHLLADRASQHQKSEVAIELLPADLPEILALAQQHQVAPSWGVRVVGAGLPEWNAPKNTPLPSHQTVLMPIPASNGLICRFGESQEIVTGTMTIAADESATLILQGRDFTLEERIWFASPNLRMRTTVHQGADGIALASFCSEIRRAEA